MALDQFTDFIASYWHWTGWIQTTDGRRSWHGGARTGDFSL